MTQKKEIIQIQMKNNFTREIVLKDGTIIHTSFNLSDDDTFKFAFNGDDKDSIYLRHTLIQPFVDHIIEELKQVNPELKKDAALDKPMYCDLIFKELNPYLYHIEMQKSKLSKKFYRRVKNYAHKILTSTLVVGEEHDGVCILIQIIIVFDTRKNKGLMETFVSSNKNGEEPYNDVYRTYVYLPYMEEIIKRKQLNEFTEQELLFYMLYFNLTDDIMKLKNRKVVQAMSNKINDYFFRGLDWGAWLNEESHKDYIRDLKSDFREELMDEVRAEVKQEVADAKQEVAEAKQEAYVAKQKVVEAKQETSEARQKVYESKMQMIHIARTLLNDSTYSLQKIIALFNIPPSEQESFKQAVTETLH